MLVVLTDDKDFITFALLKAFDNKFLYHIYCIHTKASIVIINTLYCIYIH